MSAQDISRRPYTLYSEGTRLAADLFLPGVPPPASGHPAILLCHGWGGVRHHLVPYAEAFAHAGFASMVFDYRGWGDSDGRIIALQDGPRLLEPGVRKLDVRVLREIVDPVDQVADIENCLAVLALEPGIDAARIGIWGTSFGGGHAVFVAGTNRVIRAVVAQVGGFGLDGQYRAHAQARAREKALGLLETLVPQNGLDALPGLPGSADTARMLLHAPLAAARDVRVPTLILDVEEEELVDRREHGEAAARIISQNAVCEYRVLPGKHYDIYERHAETVGRMALQWFQTYL